MINAENTKLTIKGTPNSALITRTILLGVSLPAVTLQLAFLAETQLSGPLKLLLTVPASMGAALPQPFYGRMINENGGIRSLMFLRASACIGSIVLTLLATITDLKTLESFDGRYCIAFICLFLMGISIATFQQITALVHAFPKRKIPKVQAIYGGVGGLGPAIFLVGLQITKDIFSIPVRLGLFAAAQLITTIIIYPFLHASPYHQLRKQDLTHEEAIAQAQQHIHPQEAFPITQHQGTLKSIGKTLCNYRTVPLMLQIMGSFGMVLAGNAALPPILKLGLNVKDNIAQAITIGFSVSATLTRTISSPIIQRVGAVKTYVFSSLFTIVGALMIALPDPLPGLVYIITAIFIISLGVGPATNATFQNSADWSPIEPSMNLGTVNGLVGCVGAAAGGLIPAATAALVAAFKEEGYSSIFYIVASIAATASVIALITDQYVRKTRWDFFQNCRAQEEVALPEISIEEISGENVGFNAYSCASIMNEFKVQQC